MCSNNAYNTFYENITHVVLLSLTHVYINVLDKSHISGILIRPTSISDHHMYFCVMNENFRNQRKHIEVENPIENIK